MQLVYVENPFCFLPIKKQFYNGVTSFDLLNATALCNSPSSPGADLYDTEESGAVLYKLLSRGEKYEQNPF